jgi:hypothetical protein
LVIARHFSKLTTMRRRRQQPAASGLLERAVLGLDESEENESNEDDDDLPIALLQRRESTVPAPTRSTSTAQPANDQCLTLSADRPRRQRNQTSTSDNSSDSSASSEDDPQPAKKRKGTPTNKRRNRASDDDEEYVDGSSSAAGSSDSSFRGDASSDDEDHDVKPKTPSMRAEDSSEDEKSVAVGHVQDDDIGTADESSVASTERHKSPTMPELELVSRKRPSSTKRNEILPTSFLDSSSDEDDQVSPPSPRPRPAFVCPSTTDVITEEPLPTLHVCFISPDKSQRQCFALETLRKIALQSPRPPVYYTSYTGEQHATFLQPPHFRTTMSDDLLNQIASRFGRPALDIHGTYYAETTRASSSSWPERASEHDDDYFQDRVHDYVQSQMGNQDLYTCPLCYTVGHFQCEKGKKTAVDYSLLPGHAVGQFGPMTVLRKMGPLDEMLHQPRLNADDEFRIAALVCFARLAQVKAHLRQDHGRDTTCMESNALYQRFCIRKPDGLLQRHVQHGKKRQHKTSLQGHLQQYWHGMHAYEYVGLLALVQQAEACRSLVQQAESSSRRGQSSRNRRHHDDDEESFEALDKAREYLDQGATFYRQFSRQAEPLWQVLAAPYSKEGHDDDLQDFLDSASASGSDDQNDSAAAHRAFDAQQAQDVHEEMLRKFSGATESDGEEDDSSDDDILEVYDADKTLRDSEDDDDDAADGALSEESDLENDEWMREIRDKRPRVKSARSRQRITQESLESVQRTSTTSIATVSHCTPAKQQQHSHSSTITNSNTRTATRKRRFVLESDDEMDG